MEFAGKRILVTGGAGFIGSHLVDLLLTEPCQVRVLDNFANGKPDNLRQHLGNHHFELLTGDVTDPFDVARAMEGIDYEVICHYPCI